jgi:hypothetical protein
MREDMMRDRVPSQVIQGRYEGLTMNQAAYASEKIPTAGLVGGRPLSPIETDVACIRTAMERLNCSISKLRDKLGPISITPAETAGNSQPAPAPVRSNLGHDLDGIAQEIHRMATRLEAQMQALEL